MRRSAARPRLYAVPSDPSGGAGRRLFVNTLANLASKPVGMVVAFFMTPYLLHQLGKESFGLWMLTGSVLAYTGVLKAGLNSAVSLHVPRMGHSGDRRGLERVLGTARAFYLMAAAVAGLFVAVLVWKFPDWFGVRPELRATSRWVVALVGAGVTALIPMNLWSGVLSGLQRFDLAVGREVVFTLVRAGAIVTCFTLGGGLVSLAAASVAVDVASYHTISRLARRESGGLSADPRRADWSLLPSLMAYSVSSLMFSLAQVIQMQAGKALTGILYRPAAVTEFAIPFTLLTLLGQTVITGSRALKPAITLLEAQQRQDQIRRAFFLSTRLSLAVTVPAAALFLLHGHAMLAAWIGEEMVGRGGRILAILALPLMLRTAQTAGFYVLTGLGRHRFFGTVVLVQATVSVALAWALASPGGLGPEGIAWGFALPELLVSAWILPRHCLGQLDVPLRRVMAESVLPALRGTAPAVALLVLSALFLPPEGRLAFGGLLLLGSALWAAGVWWLGLGPMERRRLASYARRGRG